jgi:hypothetical protein
LLQQSISKEDISQNKFFTSSRTLQEGASRFPNDSFINILNAANQTLFEFARVPKCLQLS